MIRNGKPAYRSFLFLFLMKQPSDVQIARFWQWFDQEKTYYEWTPPHEWDPEKLYMLNRQLTRLAPELGFEFGVVPNRHPLTLELAISANGELPLFPLVKRIVKAAPTPWERWRIVAFKQPYPEPKGLELTVEGLTLAVSQMAFVALPAGDQLNIILYAPGVRWFARQLVTSASLTLAVNLLGEYRDAMFINCYDVHDIEQEEDKENLLPLAQLPAYLDRLYQNRN
jgi:hypothetical protein